MPDGSRIEPNRGIHVQQSVRRAKRRPGLMIAAGAISLAMLAAACGGDDDDGDATNTTTAGATTTAGGATTTGGGSDTTAAPATSAAPAEDTPVPGGTLRVGVEADTNGWVPAIMQCDSACQIRAKTMFETVTSVDPEGVSRTRTWPRASSRTTTTRCGPSRCAPASPSTTARSSTPPPW